MLSFISKVRVWVRLYWPIGVGVIVAAVIAYAFWPMLVAIVIAVGSMLARGRTKPARPSPAQRRQTERDSELVQDAVDEHRLTAEQARAKAGQAGAAAAIHGANAASAPRKLAEMQPDERAALVERTKAKLRRNKPRGLQVVFALLLVTSSARAEEPMFHPDAKVQGWWIDQREKLELDEWVLELSERRDQVEDLQLQVAQLSKAADHEAVAAEMCAGSLRVTREHLEISEATVDHLAAWYRDPRLIAPLAFVGGALLVTGIVIATH